MTREIKAKATDVNTDISFVAVGDVFVSGVVAKPDGRTQDNTRANPNAVFDLVAPFLRKKDIVFCNLEGPFCAPGKHLANKRSALSSDPKNVSALQYAGFNIVSLANNQTMGYEGKGLMETVKTLESNGIVYIGGGANLKEARKAKIISKKNIKIGFLSRYINLATPGYSLIQTGAKESAPGVAELVVSPLYEPPHVNHEDFEQFAEDIAEAKSATDLLVVSCHMGMQGQTITVHQKAIAHTAIDAGADIFIGTHPHKFQGIEIYKGKVICYSLGNFAFDFNINLMPRESIVLDCMITDKTISNIFVWPCLCYQGQERQTKILLKAGKDGARIFERLDKLSRELGTQLSYENGKIAIVV